MLEWIIVAVLFVLAIVLFNFSQKYKNMYLEERSKKASVIVKHGKTMEHLIPWIKDFPGDPRKFRFIGDPIDGLLFGEDEIIFFEFKSGKSALSQAQRKIKELVKEKKVKWKEVRV